MWKPKRRRSSGAQADVQAGAQANGRAAVQADKTRAQAAGGASASSSVSAESNQPNPGLASGAAFNAALKAPINSKKCRPGDAVTAHTVENVKADGKMVLPQGSKLIGCVTQPMAPANRDSESALAIAFDRAIFKNSQEVSLNVAIQAMAAAQTTASATDADMATMGSAGAGSAGSGMAGARGRRWSNLRSG